ncbi:MAG: peptidase domain protein, partial [Deltaproteobacteria bacterium]|nr:peptidase domain protein [Deltaproteobacteria bacterium]
MRSRRLFLTIIPLVVAILFGGARFSSSRDLVRQFTMDNGLKVILEENNAAPAVALQIWVKIGGADESDEEAGICHFIEHMLFKGTEKRKVREAAREIESLGGSIGAYTSYDQTVYHVTLASRYAETGLDILSDAIQHSIFDPFELEREREVILEEIRRGQDDPSRKLFQQTMAIAYQRHPYRRPIIGYPNTIRSIQRDRMVTFFKKWYTPNRMVLIAVGDFDSKEMERSVRSAFKGFKPSPESPPDRNPEPKQGETRSRLSHGHFQETYFQMVLPISSARDEDTPPLDALSHLLGGGEPSRLVQRIKLEKGLVHSIYAATYTPKDPGL